MKRIIRSILENDGAEITALFSRQSGKCFAKGTKILMHSGRVKPVEQIKVGDKVMRPNGDFAIVTSLGRGREQMYEVRSHEKNHDSFVVNESHILALVNRKGEYENIEVKDYLKLPEWKRKDEYRGYRVAVDFDEKPLPVEPYFLGLWVGDGTSRDVSITNIDKEVIDYLYEYADRLGPHPFLVFLGNLFFLLEVQNVAFGADLGYFCHGIVHGDGHGQDQAVALSVFGNIGKTCFDGLLFVVQVHFLAVNEDLTGDSGAV